MGPYWKELNDDLCNLFRSLFNRNYLLKEINHSFITLIPKVLVNRLKEIMKEWISLCQNASSKAG